jgi:phosphatidylglycerophosphate synthase
MLDSHLRDKVQPVFDRAAAAVAQLHIQPNTITLGAFVLGVLAGIAAGMGHMLPAAVLLWFSGLLDVLDGSVARMTGRATQAGAYMDLVLDRMVEAAVILGFACLLPEHMFAYLLFFAAVLFNFTTFVVAGALFQNSGDKGMHYDPGLAERTETFIVFTLMMLVPRHVFLILMLFNGIVFLTGILRFVKVIRFSKAAEGSIAEDKDLQEGGRL